MHRHHVMGSTLLVLLLTSLTFLSTRSYGQSPTVTEQSRHCVATLEPARPGAKRIKVTSFSCYGSLSDAIFAATGGEVSLLPGEDPGAQVGRFNEQLEKSRKPLNTKATYVIAIDYVNSNFGGNTLTWTAPTPCNSSNSYQAANMPSGWNDVVSSTRGFANCNTNVLYENSNFGGALQICSPNCSGLGAMNDKTSSRFWSN